MYAKGEVQNRRATMQLMQIAFRCEYKYIIVVELHLEFVHHLHIIIFTATLLKQITKILQPFVHLSRVALAAFIFPVCSHTFLSHLVHTLGTYLHLNPFTFRTHHRNVQRLVTITFWHRNPIAQTLGISCVHIGNNRKCLPTCRLLALYRTIYNNTYSKQVINFLEWHLLFAYLIPYRMNTLCSALNRKLQTLSLEASFHWFNKFLYIGITTTFSLIQFRCNLFIYFA